MAAAQEVVEAAVAALVAALVAQEDNDQQDEEGPGRTEASFGFAMTIRYFLVNGRGLLRPFNKPFWKRLII